MNDELNVSDIPPERLLAGLYNASRQQGMGFINGRGREPMTEDEAKELLKEETQPYFDYLYGRVMKVEINGKTLDPWLYDRDNGQGAAASVIESIRSRNP